MKKSVRAIAGVAVASALMLVMGGVASAGIPPFELSVTGEVRCLETGDAEITWTAVASIQDEPTDTTIDVILQGRRLAGETSAGVQFEGEQSGAATGPVAFDPEVQFVPASNDSFPVSAQAVATAPGEGGTVVLDASVRVFNALDPEQAIEAFGEGSVELPVCEQPVVDPTSTAAAAAGGETRPRFTG